MNLPRKDVLIQPETLFRDVFQNGYMLDKSEERRGLLSGPWAIRQSIIHQVKDRHALEDPDTLNISSNVVFSDRAAQIRSALNDYSPRTRALCVLAAKLQEYGRLSKRKFQLGIHENDERCWFVANFDPSLEVQTVWIHHDKGLDDVPGRVGDFAGIRRVKPKQRDHSADRDTDLLPHASSKSGGCVSSGAIIEIQGDDTQGKGVKVRKETTTSVGLVRRKASSSLRDRQVEGQEQQGTRPTFTDRSRLSQVYRAHSNLHDQETKFPKTYQSEPNLKSSSQNNVPVAWRTSRSRPGQHTNETLEIAVERPSLTDGGDISSRTQSGLGSSRPIPSTTVQLSRATQPPNNPCRAVMVKSRTSLPRLSSIVEQNEPGESVRIEQSGTQRLSVGFEGNQRRTHSTEANDSNFPLQAITADALAAIDRLVTTNDEDDESIEIVAASEREELASEGTHSKSGVSVFTDAGRLVDPILAQRMMADNSTDIYPTTRSRPLPRSPVEAITISFTTTLKDTFKNVLSTLKGDSLANSVVFVCLSERRSERGLSEFEWSFICGKPDRSPKGAIHYRLRNEFQGVHCRPKVVPRMMFEFEELQARGYSNEQLALISLDSALELMSAAEMHRNLINSVLPKPNDDKNWNPSKMWVESELRMSEDRWLKILKPHLDTDMARIWEDIVAEAEDFVAKLRKDPTKYGTSAEYLDGKLWRRSIPTLRLRGERLDKVPRRKYADEDSGTGFQVYRKGGSR